MSSWLRSTIMIQYNGLLCFREISVIISLIRHGCLGILVDIIHSLKLLHGANVAKCNFTCETMIVHLYYFGDNSFFYFKVTVIVNLLRTYLQIWFSFATYRNSINFCVLMLHNVSLLTSFIISNSCAFDPGKSFFLVSWQLKSLRKTYFLYLNTMHLTFSVD